MNIKKYLYEDSTNLFDDQKNFFLLMWIEKEGVSNTDELVVKTGLPKETINLTINRLYSNDLIELKDYGYRITKNGIKAINKLELDDILLNELISYVKLRGEEKKLYLELLSDFRNIFIDEYIVYVLCNKDLKHRLVGIEKHNYEDEITEFFVINTLYSVAEILHKSEEYNSINLLRSYMNLYQYINSNDCYTNRVFIRYMEERNKKLTRERKKNYENCYENICHKYNRMDLLSNKNINLIKRLNALNDDASFYMKYIEDKSNTFNAGDMSCVKNSYKKNLIINMIIGVIGGSKKISEVSKKFDISEHRAKLMIASIKQKCEELLGS